MLRNLRLRDVGPAPSFDIEFSDRLNIFTGDNGLGKSFILGIAWWALTGDWAGPPAWPRRENGVHPQLEFQLNSNTGVARAPTSSDFDFKHQDWPRKRERAILPALVVYARIDGGFSVWDPARNYWKRSLTTINPMGFERHPRAFHFSQETLWYGLPKNEPTLCNGLIRDWVTWQNQWLRDVALHQVTPESSPFVVLRSLIEHFAPPPRELIEIGSPVRIHPDDVKDYPTLTMSYGDVPLVHASAGMKRVVSLAYLLTWAWDEHKRASHLRNQDPVSKMVLLFDEVESHLHPRWQRTLLPSMLEVGKALKAEVDFQILATTHAPLVLASIEPQFDEDRDSLFLFELEEKTRHVTLRTLPWAKQGDADAWLTSEVFDMKQARSKEAEEAIEAAKAFIRKDRASLPPGLKTRDQIDRRLHELLGGQDPFLIRWSISTEARGR
jgi:hypothetical protein